MPQMGVSVSEGTITKWLKQPGDAVAQDEPLLEISTDKVDTEVPSPGDGVVAEILVGEGQTVEVGTVLAIIAPAGAAVADAAATRTAPEWLRATSAAHAEPAAARARRRPAPEPAAPPAPSGSEPQAAPAAPSPAPASRRTGRRSSRPSSPGSRPSTASTRARCPGTGTGGRVTKKDILAFIESAPRRPRPPAPPAPAPAAPAAPACPGPPPQPRRRSRRRRRRRQHRCSRARSSSR